MGRRHVEWVGSSLGPSNQEGPSRCSRGIRPTREPSALEYFSLLFIFYFQKSWRCSFFWLVRNSSIWRVTKRGSISRRWGPWACWCGMRGRVGRKDSLLHLRREPTTHTIIILTWLFGYHRFPDCNILFICYSSHFSSHKAPFLTDVWSRQGPIEVVFTLQHRAHFSLPISLRARPVLYWRFGPNEGSLSLYYIFTCECLPIFLRLGPHSSLGLDSLCYIFTWECLTRPVWALSGIIRKEGGRTIGYCRPASISAPLSYPFLHSLWGPCTDPLLERYRYYDYLNLFVFLVKRSSLRGAFALLFRCCFFRRSHTRAPIPIVRLFEYQRTGHILRQRQGSAHRRRWFNVDIGGRSVGNQGIDSLGGPNGDYTANQPFVRLIFDLSIRIFISFFLFVLSFSLFLRFIVQVLFGARVVKTQTRNFDFCPTWVLSNSENRGQSESMLTRAF